MPCNTIDSNCNMHPQIVWVQISGLKTSACWVNCSIFRKSHFTFEWVISHPGHPHSTCNRSSSLCSNSRRQLDHLTTAYELIDFQLSCWRRRAQAHRVLVQKTSTLGCLSHGLEVHLLQAPSQLKANEARYSWLRVSGCLGPFRWPDGRLSL